MTPILVFDLETVPDVDGIRRINGLPVELPDADVAALEEFMTRPSALLRNDSFR